MRWLLVVLLLIVPCAAQDKKKADAIRDPKLQEAINKSISRGVAYIESRQKRTGYWDYVGGQGAYRSGMTALALYALAASGARVNDPHVARGVKWALTKGGNGYAATASHATYSASLLVLALARVDATRHRAAIRKLAAQIEKGQGANGRWSYSLSRSGAGDLSNSQFAILALWAASMHANARVSIKTWDRVRRSLGNSQAKSGGWSYNYHRARPSPSMTAAGLFGYVAADAALNGGADALAKARQSATALRGRKALLAPQRPYANYYYCYGLERAAAIMEIPASLWYVQGARYLVDRQAENGAWTDVYNTSLALLFLTRATRSILTPRRKSGPITAAGPKFPEVVTARTLKRAFEAYLLADETSRRTWMSRFGTVGPAAVALFVDRLGDPEESVRVVAYSLLSALVDKRFLFDPKADNQTRRIMRAAIETWWKREGGTLVWNEQAGRFQR